MIYYLQIKWHDACDVINPGQRGPGGDIEKQEEPWAARRCCAAGAEAHSTIPLLRVFDHFIIKMVGFFFFQEKIK